MVERNLTLPYIFVCFTDDTKGIKSNIHCQPLPSLPIEGWWYKLWFLSKEFPLEGNILFLDLDLIIFKNIDNLFKFSPDQFCIIRDFNRSLNTNWNRLNSSVFRYQSKQYSNVYNTFINDYRTNTRRFHGDQDFIFKHQPNVKFWPDEWIQSYKWEMRDRRDLQRINGKRNFKNIGTPVIKQDTRIAVFHGEPNIHECLDPWVVDNWQ
jgi:hypothetical protein